MGEFSKKAPTWLFKNGKRKLFQTQLEVDAAWEDGWHGSQDPDVENGYPRFRSKIELIGHAKTIGMIDLDPDSKLADLHDQLHDFMAELEKTDPE